MLSVLLLITIISIVLINRKDDKDLDDVSYLVVLGHKLNNDIISDVLVARLELLLNYYKNKKLKIILSGGITKGNNISEAIAMKHYLLDKGFKESNIILEDQSKDTIENIKNIKALVKDKKVLIISSKYHLNRIKMICSLLNLQVSLIGSKDTFIDKIKHLYLEFIFYIFNFIKIKVN